MTTEARTIIADIISQEVPGYSIAVVYAERILAALSAAGFKVLTSAHIEALIAERDAAYEMILLKAAERLGSETSNFVSRFPRANEVTKP